MATVETLLTAEEYGRLPDNGQRTELVRGRIVALNMPYPRHGQICSNTVYLLRTYLDTDDRGTVVCNDSGVITERDPDSVRGMDVGFYSYQRVPKGPLPRRYLDVSPDVVFEARSPGDRWPEIHTKIGEYQRANVLAVVVLDQQTESATVFRPDDPPLVLQSEQELILPEIGQFRVLVKRFFE